MSEPFYGEIRQFPYSFAPRNFAYCQGQIMTIQQNTPLFSLLGTLYGGNGQSTFGLPNLQGRVMMHQGNGPGLAPRTVGENGGSAAVTLLGPEMPSHNHIMTVKTGSPNVIGDAGAGAYLSQSPGQPSYSSDTNSLVPLAATMMGLIGGGAAHENRQPYIVMPFCIALAGMFPSRN